MKKIVFIFILIFFVNVIVPLAIVIGNDEEFFKKRYSETKKVSVYIKSEDRVEQMEINRYLSEVVAAEMPVTFNDEALKAQAVAARTYLINRIKTYEENKPPQEHKGAMICTDYSHCKAWISKEERLKSWDADKREEYWNKIENAVNCTDNEILTYNNEPISAVFHSTSSGWTENAKDVWGGDVSYLVSVKSEGDLQSPKYNSDRTYTIEEFKKIAEEKIEGVNFENYLIGNIKRSDAGGIIELDVGGILVDGDEFRFMYGLQSANIEFEIGNEQIIMNVKGYGHGVGMSQYGANYLAEQGMKYDEILKTYYTGVQICDDGY